MVRTWILKIALFLLDPALVDEGEYYWLVCVRNIKKTTTIKYNVCFIEINIIEKECLQK